MDIPVIAQLILETAWKELEVAHFENLARVNIGLDFELVDQFDYEELRKYLESINSLPKRTRDRKFEDIVNVSTDL